MQTSKYYLFDVKTAHDIARPFIDDLKHHLVGHPTINIDEVLNQWFIERLALMGVLHHDPSIEAKMPLGVIIFLNSLPEVIKGSVDSHLYRSVSNMWHPDSSVKSFIKDHTLVINA